jgi:hypothetical protein
MLLHNYRAVSLAPAQVRSPKEAKGRRETSSLRRRTIRLNDQEGKQSALKFKN